MPGIFTRLIKFQRDEKINKRRAFLQLAFFFNVIEICLGNPVCFTLESQSDHADIRV